MNTNDRVIVALDFGSEAEAKALVEELGAAATSYKVGLQLLTAEVPAIIRWLVGQGKNVFLDLKLHEIPNSVASAVTVAGSLGASMVTVHASGGSAVLRAAVKAAQPFPRLQVLALTSPRVRSTPPDQQACRVAVEDRSAGFAHATTLGAPTIAFALLWLRATNISARARSAEQPRTPGAFANQA